MVCNVLISALIRVSRAALKKVSEITKCRSTSLVYNLQAIQELNQLGDLVEQFSEVVDDIAVEFYQLQEEDSSRFDGGAISEEAGRLREITLEFLRLFAESKWFSETEDAERILFLRKACDHNIEKLKKAVAD